MSTGTNLTSYLQGGQLPDVQDDGDLLDAIDGRSGGPGDLDYLVFSGKSGLWKVGRNKDEADPDEVYLIDPSLTMEGHVCWVKSKPVGRERWPLRERAAKAVHVDDLPDHGPYGPQDGWSEELTLFMIRTSDQRQIAWSNSSVSGCMRMSDMLKEVSIRARMGEPATMPLVRLGEDEFEAQGNKNYAPVFDVVGYTSRPAAEKWLAGKLSLADMIAGKGVAQAKKQVRSRR